MTQIPCYSPRYLVYHINIPISLSYLLSKYGQVKLPTLLFAPIPLKFGAAITIHKQNKNQKVFIVIAFDVAMKCVGTLIFMDTND